MGLSQHSLNLTESTSLGESITGLGQVRALVWHFALQARAPRQADKQTKCRGNRRVCTWGVRVCLRVRLLPT